MGDLSANFNRSEFACRCGCGVDGVHPRLVIGLQRLRDATGRRITITSGRRCPYHNERIGGSRKSRHLSGLAADIVIYGLTPIEAALAAEQVREFRRGGLGYYPTKGIIHLDVPWSPLTAKRRRWAEVKGARMGLVEALGR